MVFIFCVARIKTVQLTICLHRPKTQTQKEMRSRSAQCSPEDEKVEKSQWLYAKWAVCMRLVFSLLEKHAVKRIIWKITKWKCKWWSPQGSFSALTKVVRTELNACVIWCIISFYCFLWCATFIFTEIDLSHWLFLFAKKKTFFAVIFWTFKKNKTIKYSNFGYQFCRPANWIAMNTSNLKWNGIICFLYNATRIITKAKREKKADR